MHIFGASRVVVGIVFLMVGGAFRALEFPVAAALLFGIGGFIIPFILKILVKLIVLAYREALKELNEGRIYW